MSIHNIYTSETRHGATHKEKAISHDINDMTQAYLFNNRYTLTIHLTKHMMEWK